MEAGEGGVDTVLALGADAGDVAAAAEYTYIHAYTHANIHTCMHTNIKQNSGDEMMFSHAEVQNTPRVLRASESGAYVVCHG